MVPLRPRWVFELRGCARVLRASNPASSHALSRAPLPMAAAAPGVRPLCVGFSGATRVARFQLGNLEVRFQDEATGELRTFVLPAQALRLVDMQLERWRRAAHEATLLTLNEGDEGQTLSDAAEAGGLRDTAFFLARGVAVDYIHWIENKTALEKAASNGHLGVAAVLIDAGAAELDVSLMWAAQRNHTPVLELLLDRGADIHFSSDMALTTAAAAGHLESARLLLDRGANLDALYGMDLRRVRRTGYEALVAFLLERGVSAAAFDSADEGEGGGDGSDTGDSSYDSDSSD